MKCACGYEYKWDYQQKKTIKGNQDFKCINVVMTVSQDYGPAVPPNVYACPECGTLKVDL